MKMLVLIGSTGFILGFIITMIVVVVLKMKQKRSSKLDNLESRIETLELNAEDDRY